MLNVHIRDLSPEPLAPLSRQGLGTRKTESGPGDRINRLPCQTKTYQLNNGTQLVTFLWAHCFVIFFPITPPFSLEYRASLYTRLEAKRLRLTEENKANRPRSDLDATDSDSEKQVTLCDNTCHAKRFGVYLMATANVYKCEQLVRYESDKLFFLPLIHKTTLA